MIVLVVFRVVGVVKADRFGDGQNVLFGTGKEMPTFYRMLTLQIDSIPSLGRGSFLDRIRRVDAQRHHLEIFS